MRRQQSGDVVIGRPAVVGVEGLQDRAGTPFALTVLIGLHLELQRAGGLHRGLGADRGLILEEQHPLEPDVADLGGLPERCTCGGQRHLAEGGTGHCGDIVDLVVDQPRQRRGADLGLPDVTLRLVEQLHMRAQQRVGCHQMSATAHFGGLRLEHQGSVGPGGQRGVDQIAVGQQRAEVHRGAGRVQIAEQRAQTVGHLLAATHTGQRGHRDVQRGSGLVDTTDQQRVRRQLGEHPETVLQRGLHGRGEPHGVAQVVDPVVDIAVRLLARVEQGGRVVRHLGCERGDVIEHPGQLVQDRLDLGGVRRDIDGHFAGHDLAALPVGDDPAHRLGGTTDHRGGRRGHHGDDDVLDALLLEFLTNLLRGQFDRSHGAAAGDFQAQQ